MTFHRMHFDSSPQVHLSPIQTHGIAMRSDVKCLGYSESLQWRGLQAWLVEEAPWSAQVHGGGAHGIAYCVANGTRVRRQLGHDRVDAVLQPSHFSVLPGQGSAYWDVAGSPQILHLYVHPWYLQQASREVFADDFTSRTLLPRFCTHDAVIEGIAQVVVELLRESASRRSHKSAGAVREAGAGASAGAAYAHQLASMLALRLVSHHSTEHVDGGIEAGPHTSAMGTRRPVLSDRQWHHVLQQVESTLGGHVNVQHLAQDIGVDASQLWRAFRQRLQTSPYQYVLHRRLVQARHLLGCTDLSIAQLALELGFSSQSHLTSAFKKRWGMTPAQWRKTGLG